MSRWLRTLCAEHVQPTQPITACSVRTPSSDAKSQIWEGTLTLCGQRLIQSLLPVLSQGAGSHTGHLPTPGNLLFSPFSWHGSRRSEPLCSSYLCSAPRVTAFCCWVYSSQLFSMQWSFHFLPIDLVGLHFDQILSRCLGCCCIG